MTDSEALTRAKIEALITEVVARRVTDAFVVEAAKPAHMDWLLTMLEQAFDRVEGKTKRLGKDSYIQT